MLYAIILTACKWLEYCACYCIVTADVYQEDFYDGEYSKLSQELNQTITYLFETVFAGNDEGKTNYDCFI